jgi:cyclic pyranopterin phosphate synthase
MDESYLTDTLQRALQDLRISVTDHCNFRCIYCMPKNIFGRDYHFLPKDQLLTYEEITRLAQVFVSLGVRKLRLTGGEPLLRKDMPILISMLTEIPGVEDIAMTTNGSAPLERVAELKQAGLKRITVSLDSLDEDVFKAMNDVEFPVARVLTWIDSCIEAGLSPVKVNMVVKKGINDDSILPMARYFNRPETILRFIEYMDVGNSNGWRLDDVVPAREIIRRIHAEMPVEPLSPNYAGEVATRWRYKQSGNEFGLVASVSRPFCSACTRARLSADGKLYTCLFAVEGHDLKTLMRQGASDEDLAASIRDIWRERSDRYSQLRSENTEDLPKVEMSYIGG